MARLKDLRTAAGLTQVELADAAGVPFQTIQKYERGVLKLENMTLLKAAKIAAALGIHAEELLPSENNE